MGVLALFGGSASVEAQSSFNPSGEQSTPAAEAGETTVDWYWWWWLNKDAYLQLRKSIFEGAPKTGGPGFFLGEGVKIRKFDPTKLSAYELRVLIVPAILRAVRDEDSPSGMITAGLFALAKIGTDGELSDDESFEFIISSFLDDTDLTVRERAVVALGILGSEESVPNLIELLKNSAAGHKLVDRTEVPRAMRAYAAYSMAMIGARSEDLDLRREIIRELADVLEGPRFATRDIKTACITGIGLLPLEIGEWKAAERWTFGPRPLPPDPTTTRLNQIRYLLTYMGNTRTNLDYVRSHAPTAIVRLIEGEDERTVEEVKKALVRTIRKNTPEDNLIQQASILALGELGDSDNDKSDRGLVDALIRNVKTSDQQARRYAILSLGKIAGRPGKGEEPWKNQEKIYKYLRQHMEGRGQSRMRAWSAMSLGVMMRQLLELNMPLPQRELEALRKALKECGTPLDIGAYALALGLARDSTSFDALFQKLSLFEVDTARGLILLSMGMIGAREVSEPLLEELRDIKFRGERMAFASLGLALAGEAERVPILVNLLESAGSQESQGPIVAALGVSGDRRAIGILTDVVLDDDRYADAVRVAAITGLGNVADKDSILWRAQLSAGAHYRGGVPTFLTPGSGILSMF